jgi:hypothetical protein
VDPVRDLVRDDPWNESLERSRARREQSRRSTTRRRRLRQRRARALASGVTGTTVIALAVVTVSNQFGGASHRAAKAVQAAVFVPRVGGPLTSDPTRKVGGRPAAVHRSRSTCGPATAGDGYVNPLVAAHVTGERVDQGVDYAGTGTLAALGAGRVTYVGTSATGWPGAFIEYRLSNGPDAGCFVYYAEGVKPARGLRVGQTVHGGQMIARLISGWPTGIEVGWGSGTSTQTYAARKRQWSARSDANSKATPAGQSFSKTIAALGGPAGRVEG